MNFKELKHYTTIAVFFVAVLLISNIASTKIVTLFGFEFDAGTLLFPLSYIFGDILTEVYGYKRSRKIIWLGFFMNILMVLVFMAVMYMPASGSWHNQEAFSVILGQVPRIVLASMIAYFAGEFSNSYVLAKIKVWMSGKKLWVRTISSTLIGEGVDTLLFVSVAFYGLYPNDVLLLIFLSNYVFKVSVEILFTPITYLIVGYLKRTEEMDVYDKNTNFNPFKLEA